MSFNGSHTPKVGVDPPDATKPAAVRVRDELRSRIISGQLSPGSRIVERRLCEELDVSRTPLREALKLLELDGLVELSQHRGARVRPFSTDDARELFDVLACIEGLAAERAAERLSNKALFALNETHKRMRLHFMRGEREAYFGLNTEVHHTIVAASQNKVAMSTYQTLMLRALASRYYATSVSDRWAKAMDQHEALMVALVKRDGPSAGRIWRQHMLDTGAAVATMLAERTLAPA